MATKPKAKLVDKKGKEKQEYPKLIRVSEDKKVRVESAEEEAALLAKNEVKPADSKPAGKKSWGG